MVWLLTVPALAPFFLP